MTKIYQLSGRLLFRRSIFRRSIFRAAAASVFKALFSLLLYAAWLCAGFALAVYALVFGLHPMLVLLVLLAHDVIGRGVFRHGKTDFKSWKAWFYESYVQNILLIPKWFLVLLAALLALISILIYLK